MRFSRPCKIINITRPICNHHRTPLSHRLKGNIYSGSSLASDFNAHVRPLEAVAYHVYGLLAGLLSSGDDGQQLHEVVGGVVVSGAGRLQPESANALVNHQRGHKFGRRNERARIKGASSLPVPETVMGRSIIGGCSRFGGNKPVDCVIGFLEL